MKAIAKTVILFGLFASSSFAATVTGTSFDFTGAPAISGGVLVNGIAAGPGTATANVGFFNGGFDIAGAIAANNYQGLFDNFNIVATADVGNTALNFGENYAGVYDTGGGALTATGGSPSIGQTLYTFFAVGTTLSAENIGLASALLNSGQNVAVDAFPPTDYILYTGTTGFINVTGASVSAGTFTATNLGITDQNAPAINLTPIPEPSAALLGAVGVLGLLRRRRA